MIDSNLITLLARSALPCASVTGQPSSKSCRYRVMMTFDPIKYAQIRNSPAMVAESVRFSCTVLAPECECGSGSEIRTRIRFRLPNGNAGPAPAPAPK